MSVKARATIPGTANVLVGVIDSPDVLKVPTLFGTGPDQFVCIYVGAGSKWHVERIIEPPTKTHAIIRINGESYVRGPDPRYPWIALSTGAMYQEQDMEFDVKNSDMGDSYEVIFEGTED